MRESRHLFTVKYRRRGWGQTAQRVYLREEAAHRLVDKLLDGGGRPVVELRIERRPLGEVEVVWQMGGEE